MWVHCTILDIFRPFIDTRVQDGIKLWAPEAVLAEGLYSASIKQLKILILTYEKFPCATYSIFWHPGLMYTANAVIQNRVDPDRRFYFIKCMKNYQKLFICFDAVEAIVQRLLAMGMDSGIIDVLEANRLSQEMQNKRTHHPQAWKTDTKQRRKAALIIVRYLALRDTTATTVDSLVDKFEELTVFNEFTDAEKLNAAGN
jgi:hypothetical protein